MNKIFLILFFTLPAFCKISFHQKYLAEYKKHGDVYKFFWNKETRAKYGCEYKKPDTTELHSSLDNLIGRYQISEASNFFFEKQLHISMKKSKMLLGFKEKIFDTVDVQDFRVTSCMRGTFLTIKKDNLFLKIKFGLTGTNENGLQQLFYIKGEKFLIFEDVPTKIK